MQISMVCGLDRIAQTFDKKNTKAIYISEKQSENEHIKEWAQLRIYGLFVDQNEWNSLLKEHTSHRCLSKAEREWKHLKMSATLTSMVCSLNKMAQIVYKKKTKAIDIWVK